MREKIKKMIALFQQYRITREEMHKEHAELLFDEIMDGCSKKTPLSYDGGLCGIGAVIEYLIRNGFVEGDADDILEDIDRAVIIAINKRPRMDTDIANGLLGLACYLYERLYYRPRSETPIVLTLKEHVIYLIDWIEENLRDNTVKKNCYEFYFVLVLLHQLDIFNAKIKRMLEWCDREIERNTDCK